MTDMTEDLNESSAVRIFGPTSLALLDGLIKRRCPDLDEEGNPEQGSITAQWRPDSPDIQGATYHDRLQHWRFDIASQTTSETLAKIDDLSRYEIDYIRSLAGVMGNTEILDRELGSTQHFLAVLSEQRNYNIHGMGSSHVIAPMALSLCCLVFWDYIDSEEYQAYQETILNE